MKKVVIIHTTSATIESLSKLAKEKLPEAELVNLLDDSILRDMMAGRDEKLVEERWLAYANIAQQLGADAVLSACSTVGAFAELANERQSIPVLRIDEAMAEQAVEAGGKIYVFATLLSTLRPTVDLIKRKAAAAGKVCEMETVLVEGAYEQLMQGNRKEHDKLIREQVCAVSADVIVLAQASMAAALKDTPKALAAKVLTSPESGMMRLKEAVMT